jgi:ATP synthase protein I
VPRADRTPPSDNVLRARRLLAGGALGGHAVAFLVVGLCFALRGPAGGISAAIAALGVLAFFGIGQLVQVWVADADPHVVLVAALGSYVFRVGLPAVALMLLTRDPARLAGMDRPAVAIATIAVVLGWLVAEVWTFAHLRIPVFDPPRKPSN